ncbi:MAG: hypothetical protein OXL96_10080 [Candidatus Poribacteria bacterium]|nr:hypothetical protein [Candidatus Poribacteria bacterium]
MSQVHTIKVHEQEFDETYTVHTEQNASGWIGWIQELPEVKCQRKTKEELLKVLEIELHECLKAYKVEAEVWDKQFEEDAKAGKLERFAKEALADFRAGKCEDI